MDEWTETAVEASALSLGKVPESKKTLRTAGLRRAPGLGQTEHGELPWKSLESFAAARKGKNQSKAQGDCSESVRELRGTFCMSRLC